MQAPFRHMDFPFANCLVPAGPLSHSQLQELLEYRHGLTSVLFDLKRFDLELHNLVSNKTARHATQYLAPGERLALARISSGKRQREWLGGRFAAKFAAAIIMGLAEKDLHLPDLPVLADENGRPFLAASLSCSTVPDISISHSGDLAAAMSVNEGLCGIDIQRLTGRILRVRERFCTPGEERILDAIYRTGIDKDIASLTRLWAAKESLRKTAGPGSLPGFLELKLTAVIEKNMTKDSGTAIFVFNRVYGDIDNKSVTEQLRVAVSLIADYALALAVRNDTVY